MKNPKNIVITGASSGLGKALSTHYANPGITLYLQGRNGERLEKVAEDCRKKQAIVHIKLIDVTDVNAMENWLLKCDQEKPIDLIIANAGVSAGTGGGAEATDQVRRIFATNIDGVINTIQPLIPAMVARKRGQIAIMSSMASIRGLPSCPAYSASKMCIRGYGEGLRGWLGINNVHVNVICPGYIKTPLTDVNDFHMPFIMSPAKAARIIAGGLMRNRSRIAFPRRIYWPLLAITFLPLWITDVFFAKLPAKPAAPLQ